MENLSLFGELKQSTSLEDKVQSGDVLDVVKMEFIEAETLRWKDLFSGFDTLHAIKFKR